MTYPFQRFLIVDDHVASAFSLTHYCATVAELVDTVATGQNAFVKLEAYFYDCIILDCRLPDYDGLEIARWIRQTPGQLNRFSSIIGVSADTLYTSALCQEAGMNAFLRKPYDPQSVVELIVSLV